MRQRCCLYGVPDYMSYYETARMTSIGPLVSVVIPVYNVSRYLSQCLDSVIHQTYPNIEIILIDDGSIDGCGQICDEYAGGDARVCVEHTENRGLASARNLGLEHVRGEYISFIDSDDWIEVHTLETLITTSIRTGADIVTAERRSEFDGKSIHSQRKNGNLQIFQGDEILAAYARGIFGDVVWNKLYRRECFDTIRFPDGHNYEDVFTTPRVLAAVAKRDGIVAALPEELFHFRMRQSSITHSPSLGNLLDCWMAYHWKFEALPEHEEKLVAGCYMAIGRMWRAYHGLSKEEKAEAAVAIREMRDFSRKCFPLVMKGEYSRWTKMVCIASQFKSPVVMGICGCWGWGLFKYRNAKNRLFD